ncbi:uncharacterized membrane protein YcaP (DUF421 family) [Virgibacillus halotolerans]|uniref:YetF domain-containing protein n=1 Tax=Virgibacillus halotolerans TaxID=1071053 RepID=UPI001960BD8A|nr:DUF421 domain-containing protein [Virgibacillus halotolerans]MBM7601608.1 uncharacterized membrane protein YcaP (DUF421 family) [Virgibacillus halotolerans]
MESMLPMLFETLFGFAALFILTKVLGKTQMSQLTPFDFIAAIVMGELVGNALFDKEAGLFEIGYVVVVWGVLLYMVEIITQKFKGTRFVLEGKPSIIIHKGKLIREEMRKNKIDIGEVLHLLRAKDTFSIQEVEYAIMESNGTLSVLKKSEYQPTTKADIKAPSADVNLSATLISDGEIINDNLQELHLSIDWLYNELKKQGYEKPEDVFYAEYMKDKPLFLQSFIEKQGRKKE